MKGRRFLAMLMSLVMLCMNFSSVVPMFAFAEEAPAAQQNEAVAAEPVVVEPAPQLAAEPEPQPAENSAEQPTEAPAEEPTEAPAEEPTEAPAEEPTEAPAEEPTEAPAEEPTEAPAEEPTEAPAEEPTEAPAEEPTEAPAEEPTEAPTAAPTEAPTAAPTEEPTPEPTEVPFALGKLSASKTEATVGETIAFSFDVTGAESVTWSVSRGSEILAAGEAWNGSFTWQAAISGAFTVTVKATKGDQTLEQNIGVTVREGELKAAVSSSALYGVVNEKAIDFTVAISGGVQPWSVSYAVEADGATVFTADNLSSYDNISYMPTAFGATKLVLTVVDATGATVTAASNVILVAVNERETASQWEATLPRLTADMTEIDRLVAVAKSQLGYRENARNFIIEQNGERQTYTRYGEWIGEPYGEYSAKFVSFVLKYAGLEFNPRSQTAKKLKSALGSRYVDDEDHYTPNVGDLIFLKVDRDNEDPNQVGIVTAVSGSSVTAIEGVYGDSVRENSYSLTDSKIVGYGDMHAVLGLATEEAQADAGKPAVTLTQTMSDGTVITAEIPEGALPEGIEMRAVTTDVNAAAVKVLTKNGYTQADAEAAVQELVAQGVNLGDYVAAYDISFRMPYAPEVEIEPEKPVTVSFSKVAIQADSGSDVEMYHVDDSGRVDVVDSDAGVSGSGVDATVATDAFSGYIAANSNGLLGLLGAGNDSGSWPDESEFQRPEQYAAALFEADPPKNKITTFKIELNGTDQSTEAGGLRHYKVTIHNGAAEGFQGTPHYYDGLWELYDFYENNILKLHVPAGLLIVNDQNRFQLLEDENEDTTNTNVNVEHTYTYTYTDRDAKNGADFTETFTLYIGNNGTDKAIEDYQLDGWYSTEFHILDKTVPADNKYGYQDVKTYTQTAECSTSFSTTTPDVWGVEKTKVNDVTLNLSDPNHMTATFKWTVLVGLMVNGKVSTDASDYKHNGRDQVAFIQLTDNNSATCTLDPSVSMTLESTTIAKKTSSGTGTPRNFNNNEPVILNNELAPNTTVAKVDTNNDGTPDEEVETWTYYEVTSVYELDPAVIADFSDNAKYTVNANNTVDMAAYLEDIEVPQEDDAEATNQKDLPIIEPGHVQIKKDLIPAVGQKAEYTGKYGDITYTLTSTEPFMLYTKVGTRYQPVASAEATSFSGLSANKVYYLPVGTSVTVTENLTAKQEAYMDLVEGESTLTANVAQDIKAHTTPYALYVVNKEDVKKVTVAKTDDTGVVVIGATFKLTRNGSDFTWTEQTATTTVQNNGVIEFANLPAGTYTLEETEAPKGYTHMAPTAEEQAAYPAGVTYNASSRTWTIVVDEDSAANTNISFGAKNQRNKATIRLRKYVGITQATAAEVISSGSSAPANMGSSFVLQRKTEGTDWVDVTTDVYDNAIPTTTSAFGPNTQYSLTADVPVFDPATNKVYTYRIVETVTGSYYYIDSDPTKSVKLVRGEGDNDKVYSEEKTLTDANGHAATGATYIDMANWRPVTMTVGKRFRGIGTDGKPSTTNLDKTTTVSLYRYTGDSPTATSLEEVDATGNSVAAYNTADLYNTVGKVGSNYPTAQYGNLPLYKETGEKYHYVIKEESVDGYFLYGTAAAPAARAGLVTIGGEEYVEVDLSSSATTYSTLLYNYYNAMPVVIYKQDSYTGGFVDGCFFNIKDANGTVVTTDAAGTAISGTTNGRIFRNGRTIMLPVGQKYTLEEILTNLPAGYSFDSIIETGTTNVNAEIDLTNVQPALLNTTKKIERTVKNKPDPTVKMEKTDSITGTALNKTFDIYTKDETTGAYTKLSTTLTGNTGVKLPAGTYYFAETNPGEYLDPTNPSFKDLYVAANTGNDKISFETATINGKQVVLIKVTVVDAPLTDGKNEFTFSFKNIPNWGNLKVAKYVDGVLATRDAVGDIFPITITATNGTTTITNTVNTGNDGYAVFNVDSNGKHLPVYGSDGQKIVYTITETLSGDKADTYYKVYDGQTAVLSVADGEIVTTTEDNLTEADETYGHELRVMNEKYVSVTVKKLYYDTWQQSTGDTTETPMEGAKIALYKQNDDGDWELVVAEGLTNPASTSSTGIAAFSKLEKGSYAVIEVSSSIPSMFPYQGSWKDLPAGGDAPETIDADDLSKYNYATITEANLKITNDLGTLENRNHWVQFHLTKYRDKVRDRTPSLTVSQFDNMDHDATDDEGNLLYFDKLDNVPYTLYYKVIGDDDTSVTFTAKNGSAEGWVKVESYSTGSFYVGEERQTGEFLTDVISDVNENYVFMLVEESVGPNPGTKINPNFQYTFWYCNDRDSAVSCTVNENGTTRSVPNTQGYDIDTVNPEDVLNDSFGGPGLGETLLAGLRLSKWREDDTLDENVYAPLSNAKFTLKLEDGTLLDNLTAGKEGDHEYALAQSSTFALLKIDSADAGGQGWAILKEYEPEVDNPDDPPQEGEKPQRPSYKVRYELLENEKGWTIYAIPVRVHEYFAPTGYGFSNMDYRTYLCFVDKTPGNDNTGDVYWYFSDAYFITKPADADVDGIMLAENQGGDRSWAITDANDKTNTKVLKHSTLHDLRIVDYPMKNPMVTVHKFGYDPFQKDATATGKTAEELFNDGSVKKTSNMNGVEMKLERLVSTDPAVWEAWDYVNDSEPAGAVPNIVIEGDGTDDNPYGTYTFPVGLPMGTYRLVEVDLKGWKDDYELAYTNARARVFTVPKEGCVVYMANPMKFDLTVLKVDAETGDPVANVGLTLTPSNTQGTPKTNADGTYTFAELGTNTYKLTESATGTDYSAEYYKKYADTAWAGLVNGTGLTLGYAYTKTGSAITDQDVTVEITPAALKDANGSADLKVTLKNPRLIDIDLEKVSEGTDTLVTPQAKFNVYRMLFSNVTGSIDMSSKIPANPGKTYTTAGNALTANGWTSVGTFTTSGGKFTISDKDPGVYAFVESTVPTGYEALLNNNGTPDNASDDRVIIYYAVVTGGMNVTVTGIPDTAQIGPTANDTVDTRFNGKDKATVKVENRPKVQVRVKKLTESGSFAVNDGDDNTPDYSIGSFSMTFDAYTASTGGSKTASASISQKDAEDGVVKTMRSGSNANVFSQGSTYYLEETVASGTYKNDWHIDSVTINNGALTEVDGRYAFTVTGTDPIEIVVTNRLYRGKISFTKFDADTVGDTWEVVPGARFAIYDENDNQITTARWSYDNNGPDNGHYTVLFPLTYNEGDTGDTKHSYTIREVSAPDPFLTDTTQELTVELSAKENVKNFVNSHTEGEYLVNTEGWKIIAKKHASIYGTTPDVVENEEKVLFRIYHEVSENTWEQVVNSKPDTMTGEVSYLALPGNTYAVGEAFASTDKYLRLEQVLNGAGVQQTPITITVDGEEVSVYKIDNISASVIFHFYNMRYLKPVIVKNDVTYQVTGDSTAREPRMHYAIYEWTEEGEPTDAKVEALVKNGTAVFEGDTSTIATGGRSSSGLWESNNPAERWDYTKTYILVETNVYTNKSGVTFDTMNKDHKLVKWYHKIDAVPAAELQLAEGSYRFELDNVYTEATAHVTKEVVDNPDDTLTTVTAANTDNASVGKTVESLLSGSRKVVYELTPDVDADYQALRDFTLTDDGITFVTNAGNNYTGPQPDYSITAVEVGGADMGDTTSLELTVPDNATISAAVTFLKADGTEINTQPIIVDNVRGMDTPERVSAPSGEKAKKVRIVYYSNEILNASEAAFGEKVYGLLEGFKADPVKVYATIDKMEGTKATPTCEVQNFTNTATATVNYPKWKADGSERVIVSSGNPDSDVINVNSIELPWISLQKRGPQEAVVGGEVVYTIRVTNESDSLPFISPVVLDLLPTGMTYLSYQFKPGTNGDSIKADDVSYSVMDGDFHEIPTTGEPLRIDREHAVAFEMAGQIEPGCYIEIDLTLHVGSTAAMYGTNVENDVYVSSEYHSYYTTSNPMGYSFRLNGESVTFAPQLAQAAINLDGSDPNKTAQSREERMTSGLNGYDDEDFVYIAHKHTLSLNGGDRITLGKALKGDQDTEFKESSDALGNASRTNSEATPPKEGHVEWRLTGYNWKEATSHYLAVGDALPRYEPSAWSSAWNVVMPRHLDTVMVNNTSIDEGDGENGYTLYFYIGDGYTTSSAIVNEVNNALKVCNKWNENTAWPLLQTNEPRPGWVRADSYTGDMTAVRAFVAVFHPGIELPGGSTFIITFTTPTEDITEEDEFYNRPAAFENAANRYYFNTAELDDDPLESNLVNVTLMDGLVQVEGDLWIDEDWSGVQKHYRDSYDGFDIITLLKNSISFAATENRNTVKDAGPDEHGDNTSIGESIKHFSFLNLFPSYHKQAFSLYTDEGIDSKLNLAALKPSKDPYNYFITATVADTGSLLDIIQLTTLGNGNYMSDNPDAVTAGGTNEETQNALDNNFRESARGEYFTRPFYLRYSEKVDQSKDIGFRLLRQLELTKVAKDNASVTASGAEFEIYGPFAEGDAANATEQQKTALKFREVTAEDGTVSYVLDDEGTITKLPTSASGKLLVTGLNWFAEYIVKEVTPADGYSIEGATATAADGTGTEITDLGDGEFILKLPSKTKVDPLNKVTVADPRKVDVVLNVEKLFNSLSKKAFNFKFDLKLTDEGLSDTLKALNAELIAKNPIETVEITNVTTTNGTATEQASFKAVTLNGEGTYIFTIKEQTGTNGTGDAVTYDATVITATVVVTWDATANKLVATTTYSVPNDDKTHAKFTNSYDATGTWKPTITKVLTGRTLDAEEFEFEVVETVDGEEKVLFSGKNAADGTVALNGDPIQYTLEDVGTHTYTIREKNEQAADADGDGNPDDGLTIAAAQTVTVTVSEGDTPDGKLVVTPPTANAKYTFTNEYHAKGDWTPTASKVLTGRTLKAGEFTFVLEEGAVDAEGKFTATTGTRVTATNDVNGNVNFDKTYNYTEAQVGDHYYRITEASGSLDGITYDTTEYIIKVTVSAVKGSDKLSVVATRNNAPFVDAEFNNTYDTKPTSFILEVKKTVTGPVPANDDTEFTFTLTPNSGNGSGCSMTGPATVTVKGNEVKRFPAINFTAAGKYYFELQETDGGKPGWTYDTAAKAIEIDVEDVNSQLTITKIVGATEIVDPTTDDTVGQVEVVNPYTQTETGMTVRVQKTVTGDPRPGAEENFEFTLTAKSTNPTEGCSLAPSAFKTITVAGNATGDFEFIKFTKVGTYEFTLVETDGGKAGYTYDTTPKNIKVVVTDVNSQLTISEFTVDGTNITAEGTTAIFKVPAITNEYHVTPTDYTPDAIKVIEGNDRDENQKKTFTVTLANAANETNDGATIVVNTATAVDEDTFNFVLPTGTPGAIHFTKAGTYTYTLTETLGNESGYTYDTKSWDIVVTVVDNGSQLVATAQYKQAGTEEWLASATFTNKYEPSPASRQLQVRKKLTGEPLFDAANTVFTFKLSALDGEIANKDGYKLPDTTEITISGTAVEAGGANGATATFDAISFTKAGTYYFLVEEIKGTTSHVTYDPTQWKVEIVVTDNGGTLVAGTPKYINTTTNEVATVAEAVFTNDYTPDTAKYPPKAYKSVDGEPRNNNKLETFTFELTQVSGPDGGATLPANTTVDIIDSGVTAFGNIEFSKAGTYVFKIKEKTGSNTHYKYSLDEWQLTVVVADNEGTLTVQSHNYALIGGDKTSTEQAEFINTYTPDPTAYAPKAKKTISGQTPPAYDEDDTFEFVLTATEVVAGGSYLTSDTEKTPIVANGTWTKTIVGPGVVTFDEFTYIKAGTYKYTIRETKGDTNGYTYSGDVWNLTVTVTDTGDKLERTIQYQLDTTANTEEAEFVNKYEPAPATWTPKVKKVMSDDSRPIVKTAKSFIFKLSLASANPTDGVNLSGELSKTVVLHPGETESAIGEFSQIRFTKAGTYIFTIAEEDGTAPGFAYDTTDKTTATVTISDVKGQLTVASVTYVNTDPRVVVEDNTITATHMNTYIPTPTEYKPSVNKELTTNYGPTVETKTFNFTMVPDANNPDGAVIPENGDKTTLTLEKGDDPTKTADFGTISFNRAGTFNFAITEDIPADELKEEGVTYDTDTWTLTVEVEDLDGVLSVKSTSYTNGTDTDTQMAKFTNDYKPDTTKFTPKATKTIKVDFGPTVAKKIFNFTLTLDTAVAKDGTTDVKDGADIASDTMSIEVAAGENVAENFFKKITFSKAGTYTYKIQEQVSDEEGITDDTAEKTLVIVVTDKDGALFIEEYTYTPGNHKETTADGDVLTGKEEDEDVTGATVENTYTPNPTELTPVVTKIVTIDFGPLVAEKIFNFTLKLTGEADAAGDEITDGAIIAEGGDTTTLTIPAGKTTGTATFAPIKFVKAGTYTFEVKEVEPKPEDEVKKEEGITYDPAVYTLTVVVRDTDHDLKVESYEYTKDGEVIDQGKAEFNEETGKIVEDTELTELAAIGAEFTNPYKPEPTNYEPEVEKIVTTDFGPLVEDKIFNFELKLISATPTEAVVDEPAEAEPTEGEPEAEEPETGEPEEPAAKDIKDKVTIPEGGDKVQLTVKAGETTATGKFGNIKFEQAGTYVFEANEVKEDEEGVTYSEKVWTLTLLVVDHDGELKVDEDTYTDDENNSNKDKATWTNIYVPEPTTYTPSVEKVLATPLDSTVAAKTFNFDLKLIKGVAIDKTVTEAGVTVETERDVTDGAIIPEGGDATTLTIPAGQINATANFGEITFTKAGTYTFEATEKKENEKGVTYDETVWTLTVEIEDLDGKLDVKSTNYTDGIKTDPDKATFVNTYVPEPTEYVPVVDKSMTVYNGPTVATKTFSFTMKPASNPNSGATIAQYGETATVTIPAGQANGQASFGTITFNRTGTYTFEVKEDVGAQKGITYDTHTWTLTVVVVSEDAALKVQSATWNRDDGGAVAGNALFINPYNPTPATYAPRAIKTIAGDNPATASTFTFTMTAGTVVADGSHVAGIDGSIVTGTVWTKSIVGAGSVDFDAIEYTKPGTYTYTMVENGGTAGGYTYSTANWTLTVTVTDKDGVLTATPMYTGGGAANTTAATFTNTYDAPPPPPDNVTVNVDGVKIWVDQSDMHGLRPNEITVTLYADGAPVAGATPTWTSTAGDNWTFTFQNLPANNADGTAINYTVTETPVNGYTARISGTTITNTLIPREVENFIDINGTKTWDDGGDTANRPAYITVRLFRDQVEVARQTVTAANNWSYSFTNQPADDGYGHVYTYAVREVTVEGYFQQVAGYNITNRPVPPGTQVRRRPPVENMSEEELEELIELFDYDTPLFGMMGTGDETPLYPFIFGGAGALALVAVLVLGKKRKRNEAA